MSRLDYSHKKIYRPALKKSFDFSCVNELNLLESLNGRIHLTRRESLTVL